MGKEYCSVKNCESNNSSDNIRLFKVRETWQKLIDWKGKQGAKICNIHFRPEDIGTKKLLDTAKPIFKIKTLSAEELILMDHNYALPSSETLKRRCEDASKQGRKFQKMFYQERKKVKAMAEKVKSLKAEVENAKKECKLSENFSAKLDNLMDDIPSEVFERLQAGHKNKAYHPSLRTFAITLHLHSPAAYRLVSTLPSNAYICTFLKSCYYKHQILIVIFIHTSYIDTRQFDNTIMILFI